ncbi:MAG: hypothetical protein AB9846_00270 [Tenuifilaceae bacterium]
MIIRFLSVLIIILFCSCNDDSSDNSNFFKLVNKVWTSQNGLNCSYQFFENSEYTKIWEIGIVNPQTNQVTYTSDTLNSYWRIKGNLILFSYSNDFTGAETVPTNWRIIQLDDNVLKIKMIIDMENPSILPLSFRATD